MRSLVNALLLYTPDQQLRAEVSRRWAEHADFASVEVLEGGWILACAPLARSDPQTPLPPGHGRLLFTEGAEHVIDPIDFVRCLVERPESVDRFPGDIGAVAVTDDLLTVMRSPAGLVPWYLHRDSNGMIAASTRLAWFPRHVPGSFAIDPFPHAIATDGISCDGWRTPIQGVEAVPVGTLMRISVGSGNLTVVPYWRKDEMTPSRFRRDDGSERGARLRQILVDELTADLAPDGGNLLALSGGVDSSCLAALIHRATSRPFDAFCFLPGEEHPALGHVDGFLRSITAAAPPQRLTRIHLTEERGLEAQLRAPVVGLPIPHPALSHLGGLAETQSVVVYTGGEAADDLFGGPFNLGKDWIENISAFQLGWSLRAPWYGVGRRLVARQWWGARRGSRALPLPVSSSLPSVFVDEIHEEYQDWLSQLRSRLALTHHPHRHLLLFFGMDGWLRQNWEACSELGIRRSLPFWCRETIELALTSHPRILALPPKRLVRLGMRDDVPQMNLARVDKGTWSEQAEVDFAEVLSDRMDGLVQPALLGAKVGVIDYWNADTLAVLSRSTQPVE